MHNSYDLTGARVGRDERNGGSGGGGDGGRSGSGGGRGISISHILFSTARTSLPHRHTQHHRNRNSKTNCNSNNHSQYYSPSHYQRQNSNNNHVQHSSCAFRSVRSPRKRRMTAIDEMLTSSTSIAIDQPCGHALYRHEPTTTSNHGYHQEEQYNPFTPVSQNLSISHNDDDDCKYVE